MPFNDDDESYHLALWLYDTKMQQHGKNGWLVIFLRNDRRWDEPTIYVAVALIWLVPDRRIERQLGR